MQMTEEVKHAAGAVGVWSGSFRCGGSTVQIELRAAAEGLTACRLGPAAAPEAGSLPECCAGPAGLILRQAITELEEYFDGARSEFSVPLCPEGGTPFQQEVWRAASAIPFAQTRSYWWVAVRLGNPYATRAVGGALGANPLPLFVPCHRVVRADGHLGGFTPDPGLKQILLAHESEMGGLEARFSV